VRRRHVCFTNLKVAVRNKRCDIAAARAFNKEFTVVDAFNCRCDRTRIPAQRRGREML